MSAVLMERLFALNEQANVLLDQVTELELAHQQVSESLLAVLKSEHELAQQLWNEAD